ncbi:MAG: D-erythrulose 4-kinase [Thermomicrobiales bacterium]|nr:D-erythrulose 4-kinase [Thermomicrobiales bacterium]
MTHVFNDPVNFREEMIEGYVAAFGRHLRRVPDASGVMANGAPAPDKVAVVVGGGSGHYPAFYGLVGEGMASGAVIGDIFTSPSGEQAYRVAKAVDGGAGVLFTFGNYSGDVMNFAMAETRLRAEGIDARTVLVTDDVLAAPKTQAEKRRGIAGGFYVFKSAGASAARGDGLATVEALARRANSRVRTVGVAFDGCTFPGRTEPLFTVDPGRMEVGLGIHGEPGVRTSERLSAREIAKLLVDSILADAPPDAGSRAAVLVNGLGSTKYEELFVLYQGIAPLLKQAGIETHEPQIGEFVTSLDMAGCSLTLFWLDDELQALHDAPASSPAFTRYGPGGTQTASSVGSTAAGTANASLSASARASVSAATHQTEEAGTAGEAGRIVQEALRAALATIEEREEELGRLDAAAGDGDHGAGMARGFRAAVGAAEDSLTARQTLVRGGTAFMNTAGGASGALVGAGMAAVGGALPADDDAIDALVVGRALTEGVATIERLGGAKPGDKTLLDTLDPFVRAYRAAAESGASTADAWTAALPEAERGMHSTVDMISKLGRASRLGERSRGHQDPGATSMYYVLSAVGEVLSGR